MHAAEPLKLRTVRTEGLAAWHLRRSPMSFFVAIIKLAASLWRPYRTTLPVVHLVYLFNINNLFMSCMSDAIGTPADAVPLKE
jgi:hypothetical protein